VKTNIEGNPITHVKCNHVHISHYNKYHISESLASIALLIAFSYNISNMSLLILIRIVLINTSLKLITIITFNKKKLLDEVKI